MFDPTAFLADGRFGYICCHTGADYNRTPRRILWNPLRWQIGIGRSRPCRVVLNRNGALNRHLSNLTWKLWRKRAYERRQLKDTPGMNNEREKIAEIEALLRSLLQGKFSSLTIGFNDDHACNYQTAAEWDEYEAGADSRLEWVSEIERERARSENSVWSIQWYPDTPIGFHALAASSLSALIQGVRDHLSERNTQ